MQIKTRAKFVSAILDFYYGPKLWIPDACERVHLFALNALGLNLEAPSSKIDDFLHCALYYYSQLMLQMLFLFHGSDAAICLKLNLTVQAARGLPRLAIGKIT